MNERKLNAYRAVIVVDLMATDELEAAERANEMVAHLLQQYDEEAYEAKVREIE